MAMLAGPRRKQKVVNLRAKNSAWSSDSGKFGQRMLERMGWSSGKGLGAKEDGMVEHVIARYKNDECGLGYEDKNDQWTAHEDQFNALLAGLSNGGVKAETKHSGVSLEAKSKRSKARVHYHKFTRGKDLSRYSDKDLANIFGKKSLKDKRDEKQENVAEEQTQSEDHSALFKDGGNMHDYFTSKMKAIGRTVEPMSRDYDDCAFRGFAGTQDSDVDRVETLNEIEDSDKKKKKSKRTANEKREAVEEIEHNAEAIVPLDNGLKTQDSEDMGSVDTVNKMAGSDKKKKKLKSKRANEKQVGIEEIEEKSNAEEFVEGKKLKKKKKRNADNTSTELEMNGNAVLPSNNEETDVIMTEEKNVQAVVPLENGLKKLKKKKKSNVEKTLKKLETSEKAVLPSNNEETDVITTEGKNLQAMVPLENGLKKKKKRKAESSALRELEGSENVVLPYNSETDVITKKKKSKRKKCALEEATEDVVQHKKTKSL